MEHKLYTCARCHCVVAKLRDCGMPLSCCGEPMKELAAGTAEGAAEKHIPVWHTEGDIVTVQVGSTEHPMQPEHAIEWVSLQTRQGHQYKELLPGSRPAVRFALCDGDEAEAAFSYCNLHGFWKG